jgi:hypothetical protein
MKMDKRTHDALEENMIFVGTIYDSFEALEETLGKLKLERPLFITHVAKMAFAEEVFKRAENVDDVHISAMPKVIKKSPRANRIYN